MKRGANTGHDPSRLAAIVFVSIALPAGLLFAATTPPFRVPDEVGHFWRAYALATGTLSPEIATSGATSDLPSGVRRIVQEFWRDAATQPQEFNRYTFYVGWKTPLDREQRVSVTYPGQYLPTLYAPQIAAAAVSDALGLRPLITFYVGRAAGVLAFIAVVAIAIRITPVAPWGFAVIGLLPMTLYLAASWSADTMNNALALFFAALMLRAITLREHLGRRELATLAAVAVLLATGKPPYCSMALLLIVIPAERFTNNRQRLATIALIGLAMVACAAATFTYAQRGSVSLRSDVDAAKQLRLVIADPIRFPRVIVDDLTAHGSAYFEQTVGRLGMLDLRLPWLLIWCELIAFLLAAQTSRLNVSTPVRLLALAAFAIAFTGILLALYLGWTPPGSPVVEGIQGRYFIALLPLLLIAMSGTSLANRRVVVISTVSVASIAVVVSLWKLLERYYPGSFVH